MKLSTAVVLSATVALILAPAAPAALPRTGNTLIVPGKSLGGVNLGTTAGKVEKAWGKTANCEFQCLYQGTAPKGGTATMASVLLESTATGKTPTVWSVYVAAGNKLVGKNLKPNFDTPLTRFKTAKGIGIGSTGSQLTHAYHGMLKFKSGTTTIYTLKGKKQIQTQFSVVGGRVTSIVIRSHPGG